MNKTQIIEYLGICVDMEKSIYAQQNFIDELKKERDSLQYISADPVEKQLKALPPEPRQSSKVDNDSVRIFLGVILMAIALGAGKICDICDWYSGIGMIYLALFFPITILVRIVWLIALWAVKVRSIIIILACVMVTFGVLSKIFAKNKLNRANASEMKQWQQKKREIEAYNRAEEQRVAIQVAENEKAVQEENNKIWARWNAITRQVQTAEVHLERSRRNLEEIYNKNILYRKYRTLAGVCTIYEYFESGRCDDFKEAYNKLEEELRMDKIILNLEQISDKLDKINRTQYMLYSAIQDSNSIQRQMLTNFREFSDRFEELCKHQRLSQAEMQKKLAGISASSRQTAYYAGQSAKELNYMNRMNYLSGNYANYYDNSRP